MLVYAHVNGLVSDAEMRRPCEESSEEMVATVADRIEREGVEACLLDQWEQCYAAVERGSRLGSVDVASLLAGMETVMRFHLDSEGLK